jgi:hypothetical protein
MALKKARIELTQYEKFELYIKYLHTNIEYIQSKYCNIFLNWSKEDIENYIKKMCVGPYERISSTIHLEKQKQEALNPKNCLITNDPFFLYHIDYYNNNIRKKRYIQPTIQDCKNLSKKEIEDIIKAL